MFASYREVYVLAHAVLTAVMDDDGDDDEIYAVMCPKIYKQIKCHFFFFFFFFLYSLNVSHPWAALVVGVFGAELDGDDDCDDDVLAMPKKLKNETHQKRFRSK